MSSFKPVIVVHGGAGAYILVDHLDISRQDVDDGTVTAGCQGYSVLTSGGSAIDAVTAAVTSMEDNPIFNCGYGSFLTSESTIEMDASVMNGADLTTGAVTCITNVKNPVMVARVVMDKTPHVLFCGDAAGRLAGSLGFERVSTASLTTDKALRRLKVVPETEGCVGVEQTGDHDTVGAVAMDCHGNVAYANSTGGISGKMCGRVGDSPVVGSGGYADNVTGAVAATGDGEAFMKMCTAKHVSLMMEQGVSPQAAVEEAMTQLTTRIKGAGGGCVAVNMKGEVGVHFTTKGMSWAVISDNTVQYGFYAGEKYTKPFHLIKQTD